MLTWSKMQNFTTASCIRGGVSKQPIRAEFLLSRPESIQKTYAPVCADQSQEEVDDQ